MATEVGAASPLLPLRPLPAATQGFPPSPGRVDVRRTPPPSSEVRPFMSPVFHHHAIEWFYAYLICILLNRTMLGRRAGGGGAWW